MFQIVGATIIIATAYQKEFCEKSTRDNKSVVPGVAMFASSSLRVPRKRQRQRGCNACGLCVPLEDGRVMRASTRAVL